jgi:hypothetical protein
MKITGVTQDYVRLVDSTSVKPVSAVNSSENILDPLHRPVEHTPVEAVGRTVADGEVRQKPTGTDVVELSPEAIGSISQARVEEMLREKLTETLEAEGIDLSEHQGIDYAPDAVAHRIVDFSISLYGVFRDQNAALSEHDAMAKIETTIRTAVDSGFDDAINTLEGIGLPDEVLATGHETKAQIDSRFDDFFAKSRR